MSYKLSFAERAKLAMEILSKQPPVTLEEARAQVEWLKKKSRSKIKKQRTLSNKYIATLRWSLARAARTFGKLKKSTKYYEKNHLNPYNHLIGEL